MLRKSWFKIIDRCMEIQKLSITFSGKSNDGQGENTNERKTSENNGEGQTTESTDDTNSGANHVSPSMRT